MKKKFLFFLILLFLAPQAFASELHFPFLSSPLFYPDKAKLLSLSPHRIEFETDIYGKTVSVLYQFSHFGKMLRTSEQVLSYQEEMKAELNDFMLHDQHQEKFENGSFLFSRFSFSNDEGLEKGVSYSYAGDKVFVSLSCFQKENALEALLLCAEIAKKIKNEANEKDSVFVLSDEILSPDASINFSEDFWKSGKLDSYIHYLFALSLELLQENELVCLENDQYCKALEYQLLLLSQFQNVNEKLRAEIMCSLLFGKKQKAYSLSRQLLEKKSHPFDMLLYLLSLPKHDERIFPSLEHLSFPDQKIKQYWKSVFLNRRGNQLLSQFFTNDISRSSTMLKCKKAQAFIREEKWKKARRMRSSFSSFAKGFCVDHLDLLFLLYDRHKSGVSKKLFTLEKRYPRFYASASYAEAAVSICVEDEKMKAVAWFQKAIHLFPSHLKLYKAYLYCVSEEVKVDDLRFLQTHLHHVPSSTEKFHLNAKLRLALKELSS
ncbi:MAG: hypothetical protein COX62_06440 [Deltaproteobacteria bacterium CG_4_10_14_0_2_um_filter_43_8]|nr:MAG: hypothetical protein COV43_07385 [Deltaproteobacteria bacterium CG11_big_fil_rev_8_21_14_0_20_42_23]PJA19554.1 MAG: hypothetical protein COX62_06440 [Deltaproteobacteria bacterium CG_4_10_14_0_2_um_filter_43_8]PJC63929.1 MAG: hypothetical protein CO021_06880 [Deltaproteobacteria bacterium CG_4_9_14_0_2_um_filter_42_21]